ncbi:glycosyltransferase [Candidatus Pacearchaeota archaeon]|nr:glycosyltransferase [Candidatus Pacearchaeota archaeon]
MKLQWTANYNMKGNGYGYSTHQRMLRAALEAQGVEISDAADIAVHIVVPTGFLPIFGKYNVLYTMYEGETLPPEWVPPLQLADLIVVPCRHNKHVFEKYTDKPVVVCWEGVDVERFAYVTRTFPKGEPFRYLWVGASNPRKGYEHVALGWQIFEHKYRAEWKRSVLVMKTTQQTKEERVVPFAEHHVYVDTRDYSTENLVALYGISHAFLFPTMGEGFGLTLAEAMATGLPCIYTPWSGPNDFISEREGYTLKFSMKDVRTVKLNDDGSRSIYHSTPAVSPDPEHLARRMAQVYSDYDEALRRGRAAAARIRRDITWDKSARSFMALINQNIWLKEAAA